MLTTEVEFERFLSRVPRWRVEMDRSSLPERVVLERAYQEQTHRLLDALRSGSRVRLEAAVFALEVAA